jgi:hypothetical protein
MAVINEKFATGLFIGMTPAAGIVAARAADGSDVVVVAWDPVTGDATWSAPVGSAVGGGTRQHKFDRPIVSTSTLSIGGAATITGLINGQTISAAANLTGSLTVATTFAAGGASTIGGTLSIGGTTTISAANAEFGLRDSGSAANAKHWIIVSSGGSFALQTRDDAGAFGTTAMSVVRSGTSITSFSFYAAMLPGTDNAIDFGSASFRWRHLFISGNVTADGTSGVNTFAAQTDVNNLFRVTRTSQQLSLRYDISKRLDVLVDVNGVTTFTSSLTGVVGFSGTAGSGSSYVRLMNGTGGPAHLNWQIAKSDTVAQALEFTPSTANDGVVFTTPALLVMNGATTPPRIGGASTYGMLTFNALLNVTTGMGILGRINATEGLYFQTPAGTVFSWTVAGSAVMGTDASGTYLENGKFYRAKRNTSSSIIPLLGFDAGTDNLSTTLAGDWLFKDTGTGTLFSFVQAGHFRAHGTGGFAIGTLSGVGRITFGSSAASTFSFINAGGANADIRTGLIYPDVDNAYDLGVSGTFRYRSAYFSGTVRSGLLRSVGGHTSNGYSIFINDATNVGVICSEACWLGTGTATYLAIGAYSGNGIKFYINGSSTAILVLDNAGGAVFSTTVVSTGFYVAGNTYFNSAGGESFRLTANGSVVIYGGAWTVGSLQVPNIGTTASAANVYVDNVNSNLVLRSTSSMRYKRDVVEYDIARARAIVLDEVSDAILFASLADADDPERHFVGFSAEKLWANGKGEGKRFVHLDGDGRPDGVAYASFVVPHNVLLRDHEKRIARLEALTQ